MTDVTLIESTLLDDLTHQARGSERGRKNHNFHTSNEALCHRLLNAMEPGAYVQPHRHASTDKDETLVVLRGAFGLVTFDAEGHVTKTALLRSEGGTVGVNIPHGTFHSLVSFEPGSVFFEAKGGPYHPPTEEERAPWAPREGDAGARAYLEQLYALFEPADT